MRKLVAITLLLLAITSMPVQATPLDDARNAGQVVEIPDGYVKAKGDVPVFEQITQLTYERHLTR